MAFMAVLLAMAPQSEVQAKMQRVVNRLLIVALSQVFLANIISFVTALKSSANTTEQVHLHSNHPYFYMPVKIPSLTYPTDGRVTFLGTAGVTRSEDKTVGEICTSLLSKL